VESSVRHPPEVEYSVDTILVAAAAVVEYTVAVVNSVVVAVAVGYCDCSGSEPFVAVVADPQ